MFQTNTVPVIPIPKRREEDLRNIRLKIAFISDHRRRPQQRQNSFKSVVRSRMHTHKWFISLHSLADFFQIGNADGEINLVLYLLAATAKQERGATDRFRVYGSDFTVAIGGDFADERRPVNRRDFLQHAGTSILSFDEGNKLLPGAAILQPLSQ